MDSLINFEGLSEIVINFTNKLSDAVGWIANRETPNKLAMNTYIKEIQESEMDPLVKAALISNARKTIKEYCNQNDIFKIAIQSINKDANPQNIDDDWLARFMDKAKVVSSKEFQWIWGEILARECNIPGSIPSILLYSLEKMDKEDAETFATLCRMSVKVEQENNPIIVRSKLKQYEEFGITLDRLVNLSAIGLIEIDFNIVSNGYSLEFEKIPSRIQYYGQEYKVLNTKEIPIGNVIFTKAGQALSQSIEVDKIESFWELYCLPLWKEKT